MFLKNSDENQVEGMYDGKLFVFEPGEIKPVDEDAAKHLLFSRSQLVAVDPSELVVAAKADGKVVLEEATAPAPAESPKARKSAKAVDA